ncbi:lck-interacting transmembrane adapter 1 isoform X3 [Piliocolobus tephrosceles]|uniref:lck-interacting transmembrane adapter 1 isoform X3 n=1 Tax=Piliocolobus tephrosceles TaxID=591936 RepID=UPI000C2B0826|nr:lck-interacting transmembrane adapter 1 isoform X3 [Piliocolobus tephrosceles]
MRWGAQPRAAQRPSWPAPDRAEDPWPWAWVLALQDGAASVLGSSCPLGSRVLRPAPLAVVAVHSLPQEEGAEAAGEAAGQCDGSGSASRTPDCTSCTGARAAAGELPWALPAAAATARCAGPEATYSNVGLAALPGVSLAASPGVAEYARVQKRKGTHRSPQEPQLGKAEVTPAAQVDVLYSRVCKPKRRDPGPTTDPLDPKAQGAILALASELAYPTLPLRALDVDSSPLENVYESIRELGDPAGRSSTCGTRTPPASSCPSLGRGWRPLPAPNTQDLCSFLQSEARPPPRPASQLTAPVPGPRAGSP